MVLHNARGGPPTDGDSVTRKSKKKFRFGFGQFEMTAGNWRLFNFAPAFLFYAEKGGGLVLKGQTHWTKINGFGVNTERGHLYLVFRRNPYKRWNR